MILNYISHYFTTHGVKLHTYCLPNIGKPPLVLLHGMTDSGRCWPRLAEALMADSMAADVAALIQTLELTQPIVLGHSMGAMAAASLAATLPHLVKAIILEDPGWWVKHEAATEQEQAKEIKQWQRTILKNRTQPIDAIVRYGRRKTPKWAKIEWYSWAQAKQQVNLNLTSVIRETPVLWRAVLPKISCPTLLITADPALGAIVTPDVTAEFTTLCPHGETVYIPDAGHCIRRDQFEPFMAAVQPFLQQLLKLIPLNQPL